METSIQSNPTLTCFVCRQPIEDPRISGCDTANAQWCAGDRVKDAKFVHKGECSLTSEKTMPLWEDLGVYLERQEELEWLDDADVVMLEPEPAKPAIVARRDTKFEDCCADEWQQYFPSRSEAVQSVLLSLAYRHESDEDVMRAKFERTELCAAWGTDKWARLGDTEIAKAIKYAEAHPREEQPKATTAKALIEDLLPGEPATFDPWDYAMRPLPDQKYSGWFPRGRVTLISGASGAMKTTFMAQTLVAGRDGQEFLGHAPGRMTFCMLFADRGKWDVIETFDRMGLKDRIPFECINGLGVEASLRAIARAAQEYDVLFVDGGDLLVADNNDGTSVGEFTTTLQRIAEHYGVAVVVSTGAGKFSAKALKDGAERRTMTKGSEVWGRTGGSLFTLNSEHDGTHSTRRLIVQHRNAATERFLFDLRNGLLVAIDEQAAEATASSKKMMDWVNEQDRFTPSQFKRATKYNGVNATKRLKGLERAGLIQRHESGRSVWYTVRTVEDLEAES